MKIAVLLVALVMSSAARAEIVVTNTMRFTGMVEMLERNGVFAAEWIVTLAAIEKDCDMDADKKELNRTIVAMMRNGGHTFSLEFQNMMDDISRSMDAGTERPLNMPSYWRQMVARDKEAACQLADDLWGETGQQYPGVLMKNAR